MEKVILTGASDGIGKAIAIEFAKRGHTLALMARRQEKLEEVKALCMQAGASKVLTVPIDVADEEKFGKVLLETDDVLDGATIFIANAGVTGRSNFNDDAWATTKQCLQVNIMAAIQGLELMKLRMVKRKSGTLCGVTSIAAARGMPTAGPYSTSKAALAVHLETMRLDLIPYGVAVVDVAPGFIDTEMTKKNKGKMPLLAKPGDAAVVFVDGILNKKRFVAAPRTWRWIYPIIKMLPRPLFESLAARSYKKIRG
ncbi:MAG: SDR family NAD(P)-dependent oxidoreductase [Bdellovibrionales bacterium]|nr:SDR family NAD(P)-dependent oxidoreductase [Bdellovibrionales bacterium]